MGIPKEDIIDFFKLDPSVFDDFVFLMRVYNEAMYLNDYSKNNSKSLSPFDSKSLYSNKDFLELNRFIVQKNHNNFDNKLNISKIENFILFHFVFTRMKIEPYENESILNN